MPTRPDLVKQVTNQLLKGRNYGSPKISKASWTRFYNEHNSKINWVLDRLPIRISAAVPAVIVKGLIYFGMEKTEKFCEAIQKLVFTGPEDPAHLLWLYLLSPKGKTGTPTVYAKTICAMRAHVEGRTVNRLLNVKRDFFEWDIDFTLPKELAQRNEEICREIEEAKCLQANGIGLE